MLGFHFETFQTCLKINKEFYYEVTQSIQDHMHKFPEVSKLVFWKNIYKLSLKILKLVQHT